MPEKDKNDSRKLSTLKRPHSPSRKPDTSLEAGSFQRDSTEQTRSQPLQNRDQDISEEEPGVFMARPTFISMAAPEEPIANSWSDPASDPELRAMRSSQEEPPHAVSLTAIAAESMLMGISPTATEVPELPGEDHKMQAGDPDVDPLNNEYTGDELPGRSMPTPDQNNVDEIGRVYGITDLDNGELISPEDLWEKRDAKRWEAES